MIQWFNKDVKHWNTTNIIIRLKLISLRAQKLHTIYIYAHHQNVNFKSFSQISDSLPTRIIKVRRTRYTDAAGATELHVNNEQPRELLLDG